MNRNFLGEPARTRRGSIVLHGGCIRRAIHCSRRKTNANERDAVPLDHDAEPQPCEPFHSRAETPRIVGGGCCSLRGRIGRAIGRFVLSRRRIRRMLKEANRLRGCRGSIADRSERVTGCVNTVARRRRSVPDAPKTFAGVELRLRILALVQRVLEPHPQNSATAHRELSMAIREPPIALRKVPTGRQKAARKFGRT
jgi:hypothetical protein